MVSTTAFAQEADTTETTTIPTEELQQFFADVDSLQAENADYRELLTLRRMEIMKLEFVVSQDSLLFTYKDRRISLLEDEIKLHTDYIARINKRSWRNSKVLWFATGAMTIYVSSIVLNNINGAQGN